MWLYESSMLTVNSCRADSTPHLGKKKVWLMCSKVSLAKANMDTPAKRKECAVQTNNGEKHRHWLSLSMEPQNLIRYTCNATLRDVADTQH